MRVHQRRGRTGEALAVMLRCMPLEIRDQRQVARALDRRRELALVTRAGPAQATGKDLPLIGDETSERPVVLVVDPADATLAERTAFLWSSHVCLVLVVVVIVAPRSRRGNVFLAHCGSSDFVLVHRNEVADQSVIEPERALVFG
jgi:hypothetical protein